MATRGGTNIRSANEDSESDARRADARFEPEDFDLFVLFRRSEIEGDLTLGEENAFLERCRNDFDEIGAQTPEVRRKLKREMDRVQETVRATGGPTRQGAPRPYGTPTGLDSGKILLDGRGRRDTAAPVKKKAVVELNQIIRLSQTDPELQLRFLTTVSTPAQYLDEMEKKNPYYRMLNKKLIKDIEKASTSELQGLFIDYSNDVVPLCAISAQCFFVTLICILTRNTESGPKAVVLGGHTSQFVEQLGRLHWNNMVDFWAGPGQQQFNPALITGKAYEYRPNFGFQCFIEVHGPEHAANSFWALVDYLGGDQGQFATVNVSLYKHRWGWLTEEERAMNPQLPKQRTHPVEQQDHELFQDWMMREAGPFADYQNALFQDKRAETTDRERIRNARMATTQQGLMTLFDRRQADLGLTWESMSYHVYCKEIKIAEKTLLLTQRTATMRRYHSASSHADTSGTLAAARPSIPRPAQAEKGAGKGAGKGSPKQDSEPAGKGKGKGNSTDASRPMYEYRARDSAPKPGPLRCRRCLGEHNASDCKIDAPVCNAFQVNACEYGNNCKFIHKKKPAPSAVYVIEDTWADEEAAMDAQQLAHEGAQGDEDACQEFEEEVYIEDYDYEQDETYAVDDAPQDQDQCSAMHHQELNFWWNFDDDAPDEVHVIDSDGSDSPPPSRSHLAENYPWSNLSGNDTDSDIDAPSATAESSVESSPDGIELTQPRAARALYMPAPDPHPYDTIVDAMATATIAAEGEGARAFERALTPNYDSPEHERMLRRFLSDGAAPEGPWPSEPREHNVFYDDSARFERLAAEASRREQRGAPGEPEPTFLESIVSVGDTVRRFAALEKILAASNTSVNDQGLDEQHRETAADMLASQGPTASASSDDESSAGTDSADKLPTDHHAWLVRCLKRDRQHVSSALLEALDLEQSPSRLSPIKKRTRPAAARKAPLYYTTEFAGDITALQAASILDSPGEMRRAYGDSDVGSASGSLDSQAESCSEDSDDDRPICDVRRPMAVYGPQRPPMRQASITKCSCPCVCDTVTWNSNMCRICSLGICLNPTPAAVPETDAPETTMHYPATVHGASTAARVVVMTAQGEWVVVSTTDSVFTTSGISLLRFDRDSGATMSDSILRGLNDMLSGGQLTASDVHYLPRQSVPDAIASGLYFVQLREGSLSPPVLHFLHLDENVLRIHRACAMHINDALLAMEAWRSATTEPEQAQQAADPSDFRPARRGEINTRD